MLLRGKAIEVGDVERGFRCSFRKRREVRAEQGEDSAQLAGGGVTLAMREVGFKP